jgi:hypothetical protein
VTTDEAAPHAADGTAAEDTAKVLDVPRPLWDDENLIVLDERAWLRRHAPAGGTS